MNSGAKDVLKCVINQGNNTIMSCKTNYSAEMLMQVAKWHRTDQMSPPIKDLNGQRVDIERGFSVQDFFKRCSCVMSP